jgi:hypothetical protein
MQSLEKKQSKQMGYHNGITAGTDLSCAAKPGGWHTKPSLTAVRTMGQARGEKPRLRWATLWSCPDADLKLVRVNSQPPGADV